MKTTFDALSTAEQSVLSAIAQVRDEKPEHILQTCAEGGQPAVVDGRLARLRLYSTPPQLDLRGLDGLIEVHVIWSAELEQLTLGSHPHLRVLRLDRCKLASLDLSGCTTLEVLQVSQNQLTSLEGLPSSLRELTCGANPLTHLDVSRLERLEILNATRCALTSLDVAPLRALRELVAVSNPLNRLDAQALTELEVFYAGNSAGEVLLPRAPGLRKLSVDGAPFSSLDASRYPNLVYLSASGCGLQSVALANPCLTSMDLSRNALEQIDISSAPGLRRLTATDNPLAHLDLTGLSRLAELEVPPSTTIRCTELQQAVIPALRARSGLSKPTSALAKMDAYQLHRFVDDYNWDDGEKKLLQVIQHPACDLATALLVYWLSEPGEFAAYRGPADAPVSERKMVGLLREIEAKVEAGGFLTARIPFDVHDVGGVDLSDVDPQIPAAMRCGVSQPDGVVVTLPPAPPTTKKRAKP